MYDDILVPTDGSEGVTEAITHGFDLATRYGATVHALYVIDNSRGESSLMSAGEGSTTTQLREEGQRAVEDITTRGEDADVEVVTEVRESVPHDGILEYSDDHDIDIIVMGSHGRSGVSRFLFGSVTERVLRLTDRPVLVVGREEETATPGSS